jgi:hypothetical protein
MRFLNSCTVNSKSVARSERIDSSGNIIVVLLELSGELPCGSVRMPDVVRLGADQVQSASFGLCIYH